MSRQQFISLILEDERPKRPPRTAGADAAPRSGVLFDASLFGEKPPTIAAHDGIGFARTLLEGSGFGDGRIRETAEVILGDNPAKRSLPQSCWLWPKTSDRPHRTLLFQLDSPGSVLLEDGLFRDQRQQKRLEDALHRLIQTAQQGFAVGGGKRTADVEQGKPEETLILVSVDDDRKRQDAPVTLVCFGTVTETTGAFEAFHITNEARQWAKENRALAEDHLSRLYYRHFEKLASETWQDAFVTGKERDLARKLLDVCTAVTPDAKRIEETAVKLIRQIATSFGRGHQSPKIEFDLLPKDHFIGADPKAAERPGFENDFAGMTVRDGRERLLGYIVYCLDEKRQADRLRASLAEHNSFHNVLVIYPDGDEATLELWQGKRSLKGKLTKAGAQFRGEGEVVNLLSRFFVVSKSEIASPTELARDLAHRAGYLKIIALGELEREQKLPKTAKRPVLDLYEVFDKALARQTEKEFADAYAQTLTYGLLAARWMARSSDMAFTVANVGDLLPSTSPFLADLFKRLIALHRSPRLGWLIEDLVSLLHRTAVREVFADEEREPVIHFYEDFLHAYDPQIRQLRGVYYTPDAAVQFVVNAVDEVITRQVSSPEGLADKTRWDSGKNKGQHRVQILDPACGTGTFLRHVIRRIHQHFITSLDASGVSPDRIRALWAEYVQADLAPRLYGFEIMVAPYVICHLQLSLTLAETGLQGDELPRLNVFLTNTLQDPQSRQASLPGYDFLTVEAKAASKVKRDAAVSVIVGNPPYSSSMYEDPWILGLVEAYKEGLNEKKLDINREEWKFFRYAHHRMEGHPIGAIGFVINRSYLDGVTLRQMRDKLGQAFRYSLVVDLHGDVKGRAVESDLGRDENIFEIEQGICVSVLGRNPTSQRSHYYRSLPGPVTHKSEWLRTTSLSDAEAQSVRFEPKGPYYLWVAKRGAENLLAYDSWPKVSDVFQLYSSGIQTKRDRLTIHFTRDELNSTVREFSALSVDAARSTFGLPADGRDWTIAGAKDDLQKHGCDISRAIEILYRPFDRRWTYFTGKTKGFLGYPRREVMQHFVGRDNIGLIVNRQVVSDTVTHFGVTRIPNCHGTYYLGNKGQDYLLPLYRFDAPTPMELRSGVSGDRPTSNLAPDFVKRLERSTRLSRVAVGHGDLVGTFGPDDVLRFLLAVFHSPGYRLRYDDGLHVDFPRVPTSPSRGLFAALVPLGSGLVAAHTLAPTIEPASDVRLIGTNFRVEKVASRNKPIPVQEGCARIPINGHAWFEGVVDEDWTFEVGGYQPLYKWLEARKKATRTLSDEDVLTFRRIVTALRTIRRAMGDIDDAIGAHGGWPDAFGTTEPKS